MYSPCKLWNASEPAGTFFAFIASLLFPLLPQQLSFHAATANLSPRKTYPLSRQYLSFCLLSSTILFCSRNILYTCYYQNHLLVFLTVCVHNVKIIQKTKIVCGNKLYIKKVCTYTIYDLFCRWPMSNISVYRRFRAFCSNVSCWILPFSLSFCEENNKKYTPGNKSYTRKPFVATDCAFCGNKQTLCRNFKRLKFCSRKILKNMPYNIDVCQETCYKSSKNVTYFCLQSIVLKLCTCTTKKVKKSR